jgi:hypothetical protein
MAHKFDIRKFLWQDFEISHRRHICNYRNIKNQIRHAGLLEIKFKLHLSSSNKSLSTWKVMIERLFMQILLWIFALCVFHILASICHSVLEKSPQKILESRNVGGRTVALYFGEQTNLFLQFAYFLRDVSATWC